MGRSGRGGHAHVRLWPPYPVPHVLSPYVTTTESCRGGRGQGQALAGREWTTATTTTADVAGPARRCSRRLLLNNVAQARRVPMSSLDVDALPPRPWRFTRAVAGTFIVGGHDLLTLRNRSK